MEGSSASDASKKDDQRSAEVLDESDVSISGVGAEGSFSQGEQAESAKGSEATGPEEAPTSMKKDSSEQAEESEATAQEKADEEKAKEGVQPVEEVKSTAIDEEAEQRFLDLVNLRLREYLRENGLPSTTAQAGLLVKFCAEDVEVLAKAFGEDLERAPSALMSNLNEGKSIPEAAEFARMMLRVRKEFWPVNVGLKNVSYTVTVSKTSLGIQTVGNRIMAMLEPFRMIMRGCRQDTEDIHVLRNISTCFKSGVPTLVLGPPRSGVSTLFKAMAGRLEIGKRHKLDGTMLYSGFSAKELKLRKVANLVGQDDQHIPVLTVQETVEFAYSLLHDLDNLRDHVMTTGEGSPEENARLADTLEGFPLFILELFGLSKVKDTVVGNAMLRGVSGGERKRVTTTEILMARRPFTMFDQISTGLDSAATFDIAKQICEVARILSLTSVVSLLQPPPEVFNLFDEVLVLAKGMIMFHGPVKDVLPYFESIGYSCPENKDVADFLQEVTTDMRKTYATRPDAPNSEQDMAKAWEASEFSLTKRQDMETWTDASNKIDTPLREERFGRNSPDYALPFWKEFRTVLARQRTLFIRNTPLIRARLGQAVIMGIIIGTVFYQIPTDLENSLSSISQRYGIMLILLMQMALTGLAGVALVVDSRPIFDKQYQAGFFRPATFVLADAIVNIPLALVETIIMGTFVFWLSGLVPVDFDTAVGAYFALLAFMFMVNISMASFFRAIGTTQSSTAVAQTVAGVMVVFCVLFSGFIITPNNIPPWFIWIYWASPIAWALRSTALVVFYSWPTDAQTDVALSLFSFQTEKEYIWAGAVYLMATFFINLLLTWVGYSFVHPASSQVHASEGIHVSDNEDVNEAAETEYPEKSTATGEGGEVQQIEQQATEGHVAIQMRQSSVHNLEAQCTRVNLAFRDLWYSVPSPGGKKNDTIDLLKGVSGFAEAGTMTALMGSSGAGKTTLMDVIAGRKTGGSIRGDILVNGRPKEAVSFARIMGYVEQMDIHSPHATVEEALLFSAMLRQSEADVTVEEKKKFAENVLIAMELDPIRAMEIGDRASGGLSIEQAKRVTIGVELAANPSILFADEPTSGLDARAALIVMRAIRRVAQSGRAVVCTIHQPSRDIFQSFDRLLLLKRGGEMVFFGDLGHNSQNLLSYLEQVSGETMPNPRYNPATFMLEVIGAGTSNAITTDFAQAYKASELAATNQARLDQIVQRDLEELDEVKFDSVYATSFMTQQKELIKRWAKTYWRSPTYNFTRIVVFIAMGFLFGLSFLDAKISTPQDVQSVLGVIYMSTVFMGIINMMSTIPLVFSERPAYYRERAGGMYTVVPYVIAHSLAEVPYELAFSLLFMVIFYFLVGFTQSAATYFTFWAVFLLYVFTLTFLGQLLASLTPSEPVAGILAGAYNGLASLFAGFMIAAPDITDFWQFLVYLNPLHYAWTALCQIQLECSCPTPDNCNDISMGCSGVELTPTVTVTAEQYAMTVWQFQFTNTNAYIGAVCGFFVGFRILAVLALAFINFQKR